jgi:hypothetical protein
VQPLCARDDFHFSGHPISTIKKHNEGLPSLAIAVENAEDWTRGTKPKAGWIDAEIDSGISSMNTS